MINSRSKSLHRASRPARRIPISKRAGFSLIDAVSVIVTTGLLLSFSAILLQQTYQSYSKALQRLQDQRRMQLAGDRFRSDVQAAEICEVVEGQGARLTLSRSDGRSVVYEAIPVSLDSPLSAAATSRSGVIQAHVTRIVLERGQEVGRESLQLPQLEQVRWSIDRTGRLPLVSCQLTTLSGKPLVWLCCMRQSARPSNDSPEQPSDSSQQQGAAE